MTKRLALNTKMAPSVLPSRLERIQAAIEQIVSCNQMQCMQIAPFALSNLADQHQTDAKNNKKQLIFTPKTSTPETTQEAGNHPMAPSQAH